MGWVRRVVASRGSLLSSAWPLTLGVALFVALPIVVLGEISAQDARARVHADQLALTRALAVQAAANLDHAVVTIRDQVAAVATRPASGKPTALIDAVQRNDLSSVEAQLVTLQSVTGISLQSAESGALRSYVGDVLLGTIVLTNADGTIIADTGSGSVGKSIRDHPAWGLATKATPVQISPPFNPVGLAHPQNIGNAGGFVTVSNIVLEVVVYVDRAQDGAPAYLLLALSPIRIATRTLQELLPLAAEVYVVDGTGRLVLRKSHAFAQDDSALTDLSSRSAVITAGKSDSASFDGADPFDGVTRSMGSAVVADLGWRVIVEQDVSATELDLETALQQQRATRGLLTLLLVGATYFVARGASQIRRQRRALAESLERETATSDVLQVISRSAFDLDRVLQIVVESATRLCGADTGVLWRSGDNGYTLAAFWGRDSDTYEPERREALLKKLDERRSRPLLASPNTGVTGRAAFEKRPVQVEDVTTDPGYLEYAPDIVAEAAASRAARTRLAVPLLREGEPIGVMHLGRFEVKRFTDAEIALVSTFADQAAVAIENTRLLNELRDANVALKHATEVKSKFLATMSHELRTPLNAIIGFSDVLLQRMVGELNAKQREYLGDIRSSGTHQLDLINDLLDLSKIEAGRLELDLGTVSIAELIASSAMFVRERAAAHSLSVDTIVAGDLPSVEADGRKLKQVVVNLLTNAVKFTPDGGHIVASAGRRRGDVVVSVRDDGVGIAQADQARLFEEFAQTPSGRTSDEGTGLGLALSKRLVELHGGQIWVESQPGRGSTFSFSIPLTRSAAPQTPTSGPPNADPRPA